jgi:hypothetical protein
MIEKSPREKVMFESYLSKVIITFIGAACAFAAIAGGFYTTFRLITLIGA